MNVATRAAVRPQRVTCRDEGLCRARVTARPRQLARAVVHGASVSELTDGIRSTDRSIEDNILSTLYSHLERTHHQARPSGHSTPLQWYERDGPRRTALHRLFFFTGISVSSTL
jgi:hypothetical protein